MKRRRSCESIVSIAWRVRTGKLGIFYGHFRTRMEGLPVDGGEGALFGKAFNTRPIAMHSADLIVVVAVGLSTI